MVGELPNASSKLWTWVFNAADRMVKVFGHLGERGWRFVGVYDRASNWFGQMEKGFALFKREVPDGEEPNRPWGSAAG